MCRPILLKSSFLQGKPYASVALTLKNLNIFELVLCLQGVKIIDESHDQDTTDLHKCVIFIRDYVPDLDKNHIKLLVLGGLGGRFDHEAANINVLYTFATVLRIVLLSEESSLTLLPSGYLHEIHVNRSFEGPHCGLVPLGAPSTSSTTTGLHWNLGTYKSAL
jgi:thiamine pyrophosphokinase